jgi:uncharacterized membrane protein HdeD (DUF308 family)
MTQVSNKERNANRRNVPLTAVPDIALLRGRGNWHAKLGIVLIMMGILTISLIKLLPTNSIPLLGWLILVSGMVEAVHAFHVRSSSEFFFHLMPAIAGVPLGLLMATHPGVGILPWMLVFASFFTVVGLFRLIAAVRLKFPGWTWVFIDGLATLLLGCIFWTTWTWLGSWFFDFAVGVSLLLRGWSSIMSGRPLRDRRSSKGTNWATSEQAKQHPESTEAYRVEATDLS